MNHFLYAVGMMAALDIGSESHGTHVHRRQWTAEELDDFVDGGWHLPDHKGAWIACAEALRWRWRPRASHRLDPTPLPLVAITSHQ